MFSDIHVQEHPIQLAQSQQNADQKDSLIQFLRAQQENSSVFIATLTFISLVFTFPK